MSDIQKHPLSIYGERAKRTKISTSYVHRTMMYLFEIEHIMKSHKEEVFLTQRGEKAKNALETLSRLVKR